MNTISLIVAMAENRVIGVQNQLPWNLPNDMKWFRRHTLGKAVVMGRSTFESIGKPLPQRTNIVLTRDATFSAPGCVVVHSIDEAIAAAGEGEAMVIGGESIYSQFLPCADRVYLTEVHATIDGDAWFPELPRDRWQESLREEHPADEHHPWSYSFVILERAQG